MSLESTLSPKNFPADTQEPLSVSDEDKHYSSALTPLIGTDFLIPLFESKLLPPKITDDLSAIICNSIKISPLSEIEVYGSRFHKTVHAYHHFASFETFTALVTSPFAKTSLGENLALASYFTPLSLNKNYLEEEKTRNCFFAIANQYYPANSYPKYPLTSYPRMTDNKLFKLPFFPKVEQKEAAIETIKNNHAYLHQQTLKLEDIFSLESFPADLILSSEPIVPSDEQSLLHCRVDYFEILYSSLEPLPIKAEVTHPIISLDEPTPHPIILMGQALYHDYIEPKLCKEYVDKFVVGSISLSIYYSLIPSPAQEGHISFLKRAEIAIGFKLFKTFVSPALFQWVDQCTQTALYSAKYTYHKIRCLSDIIYCNELTKFQLSSGDDKLSTLPQLLSFDSGSYWQELTKGLNKLSLTGLLSTGIISAASSSIKDVTYEITGFNQYCQGNFCKKWVSYWYKETIKINLKWLVSPKTETPSLTDQNATIKNNIHLAEYPKIDIKEVIDSGSFCSESPSPLSYNDTGYLHLKYLEEIPPLVEI